MKNVVIIGAGASGIVASIYARKMKNNVIIIEKNEICGKKLLATGNGRCNYWNDDQCIEHYRTKNIQELKEILSTQNKKEILNFFKRIGIEPKIKNGYYYPFSNQAVSMQRALVTEAIKIGVKIENNSEVLDIVRENGKFKVVLKEKKEIFGDKIIISTGSMAAPKTGSDGWGYKICKKFNHSVIKPLPALVQLKTEGNFLKQWEGIRTDVSLELYENGKNIARENGELQLTNYGISGICVFNLSGRIARGIEDGKNEMVKINFLDGLKIKSKDEFFKWMDTRDENIQGRTISELLDGILNYKLVKLLLNLSGIKNEDSWGKIDFKLKNKIAKNIIEFELNVIGTNSYDKAQVCTGGIPLSEIKTNTMESKKVNGM